ncbi:ABC transporter permease [Chloroflexus sp. MS-CIW-1]|uniref:ABC transporter permease n=1 Tax=Chloroflexus sp. MS-CIW-1 TaxID=3055768 RepID=UPI002648EAB4|nr:ABC transporter permease [Chloroflexus sp. MS-CIW-1]MDN5273622.1 ABC transporter permease [Chloroflexus sp. MS-CIW-1]
MLNLIEALRIAFNSLLANKLRAILTMLGIIIGVGAVIALLALGGAIQTLVTSELQGLGSNLVFLFAGTNDPETNRRVPPRLTNEDIAAIADPLNVPAVAAVCAEFSRRALTTYGGASYDALIAGVSANYLQVRNARVAVGSFFDERSIELRSREAVLGHRVAQRLFPNGADPIGQRIRINGIGFQVIGVMAERGGSFASNEDDQIFVPLTTAQDRLFPPAQNVTRRVDVTVVYIQARDEKSIDDLIDQVTALLRQRNGLTYQDNNFTIVTQQDLVSSFATITGAITIFLGAIAAISLVVGGIGIMNIMLVSVTERTREIGLRKAVGARRNDIRLQFLVEATVLSLMGGVLGIALGYALAAIGTALLANFSPNARAEVSLDAILLATLTSIAVGIFFGLYPADRAARLDPIAALRYE